jgi:hypothetical protein
MTGRRVQTALLLHHTRQPDASHRIVAPVHATQSARTMPMDYLQIFQSVKDVVRNDRKDDCTKLVRQQNQSTFLVRQDVALTHDWRVAES